MIANAVKLKAKETGRTAKPPKSLPAPVVSSAGFDGLFLQRKASCACGGGCPSCQAKGLKVSSPNDASEIEADEIANKVMRMPLPSAQRSFAAPKGTGSGQNVRHSPTATSVNPKGHSKPPPTGDKGEAVPENIEIRRFASANANPGSGSHSPVNALGPGTPLDPQTRSFFEPRFGADLSSVRLHTGVQAARSAQSFSSLAYTAGNDIVFNENQYRPETETGKALLAHELVHTLQQNREVRRWPLPAPADTGTGSEPAPEDTDTGSESGPVDPTEVPMESGAPVERVIVSCPDKVIVFVTGNGVFVYALHSCEIPVKSYEAGVSVVKNRVQWSLGTHEGEGFKEQAGFVYKIKKGQPNPAKLFKNQKSVRVDSVAQIQMAQGPPGEQCQMMFREREVIAANGFSRELFEPISVEHTIWSHEIPLAQFGWVEVSAMIGGDANGMFSGSYGPGILSNICLFRQMPKGRMGGRAHFSLAGSLDAAINLTGNLSLAGKYLSVIPVISVDGVVDVAAQATGKAAIDADIEVAYNPKPAPGETQWEFSADSSLDVKAALALWGNTYIGLEFLGKEIWGETWNLIDSKVNASWQGGLIIRPDLSIEFNSGDLKIERGAGDVSTLGTEDPSASGSPPSGDGPKASGKRKRGSRITLEKIVELATAVYDESQANVTARPVLAPKMPGYSRYSLGAQGATIDPDIIKQAYDKRLNETDMSYDTFFKNIAVLSVEIDGVHRYIVSMNDPDRLHSESVVFKELEAIDKTYRRTRVLQLYTERAPCPLCRGDMIGARAILKQDFPVFFSIPLSPSSRINATNLMEAYGLTPP